jgi:hypothetical protein
VKTELEGTELIKRVTVRFDQAIEWVMNSHITHAPSMTIILKAAHYLAGKVC